MSTEELELLSKINFNIEVLKNAFLLFLSVLIAVLVIYLFYKAIDNFISF